MKKLLSIILSIFIAACLCGCENIDLDSLYSDLLNEFEDGLYLTEEFVEVRYEEYEVRNPQFSECFSALNSKQKQLYQKIYAISEEMPQGFVKLGENYDGAQNDVAIAYKAFLNDKAEVFWMPKSYILGSSNNSKYLAIAFEYSDEDSNNSYTVNKEKRNELKATLDAVCQKVMTETQKLKTEYEKEKYINDYLCDTVAYTESGKFVNTSYGALVEGSALCEGYSRAFKLLCNNAGIECSLIVGQSQGEGHMWNRVNIDKKLSYVDVTWNDRTEFKTYTYFNITEEQLLFDHTLAPLFSKLKEGNIRSTLFNFTYRDCSYTGNTFYEKNGRTLWQDYFNTAPQKIESASEKGETYTEFMFATDNIKNIFEKDPETFLINIQNKLISVTITGYTAERDTLIIFFE